MSQTQKYQLALAYHLLWTSSEDVACQYSATCLARLTQGTPAHNAVHCQVALASGRSLGGDWRRRPGRPHARWTDQLRNDTGSVPANLWRQTGHSTGRAMVERRDGPSWLRGLDHSRAVAHTGFLSEKVKTGIHMKLYPKKLS